MAIVKSCKTDLTETGIANILSEYFGGLHHKTKCNNLYLYSWESDFVSVTKAGRVHEVEIKVSKSDFKADFKKVDKHNFIENGSDGIKSNDFTFVGRPNHFWYICPEGLIMPEDVPSYAGLMWVKYNYPKVKKDAPLIHKNQISYMQSIRLGRSLAYKYWTLRKQLSFNS